MVESICIKEALGNGEVMIITNIDFEEDYSKIRSFAIILLFLDGKHKYEIVKYDFSEREKFNIHYSYLKKPKKFFVEKGLNSEDEISNRMNIFCYNFLKKPKVMFRQF